ncbi:MAG: hypothetical protein ACE5FW_02805 [Candidatus Aenigmatarchaeota archaeon]
MTDLLTLGIPFFLVFAIVYGALEVAGIFKENKKLNAIIALIMGFFAITSEQVVALTYTFMPYASILFIVVFFLGFILAPFRGKEGEKDFSLIAVVAMLIVLFLASQGQQMLVDLFPTLGISGENFFVVAGLLIFIAIFYAAYQHGKGEKK